MTARQIASEAISSFLEALERMDCEPQIDYDEIERARARALREFGDAATADAAEMERLRAVNAELLAACESLNNIVDHVCYTLRGSLPVGSFDDSSLVRGYRTTEFDSLRKADAIINLARTKAKESQP